MRVNDNIRTNNPFKIGDIVVGKAAKALSIQDYTKRYHDLPLKVTSVSREFIRINGEHSGTAHTCFDWADDPDHFDEDLFKI